MNRHIKKIAVLGSGVMGSRIACHFANIGVAVLLLDMPAKDAPAEKPAQRNKLVNDALAAAIKSNPSPLYSKAFAQRIATGNFEDDMPRIATCDWVIEVVVERLNIKKIIFEQVEQYRTAGTIVSSNTSGIPIHLMAEGRSADFCQHFCGTHFFNPPRYLRLLEIIPTKDTLPEVTSFLMMYGEKFLGKTTVLAKDTPAFIGNRIGVFSMMQILQYAERTGMSVAAIDKLTGPAIGRPKSATFRTADVVGLDTLVHVAKGLSSVVTEAEKASFHTPGFIATMLDNNWLGNKSGQGFYKKVVNNGKPEYHALDLASLEYKPAAKTSFPSLEAGKTIDDLSQRLKMLVNARDEAGDFYRETFYGLFAYASSHIPEVADELYKIDDAIEAGFGWEMGPFKLWDALDVATTVQQMEARGQQPAAWVHTMLEAGNTSFYKTEKGKKLYYDIATATYKQIPGTEQFLLLSNLSSKDIVWKNSGTTVTDLGDGILNLAFHTKMNTIGGEVLEGIHKAIDLAEREHSGLVVSNEGSHFSAGANVGLIFMMAVEQEYEELDFAVRQFQQTMMRVRYSPVPVIAAPHGMTLGGGCELCLHADKVVAHAETYMGLVEFGVGLIPGGGGTKEFTLRLSDSFRDGDIQQNNFRERFLTIGQAKVSTSAAEAFELGYLRKGQDVVVVSRDRQLAEAKKHCLQLANAGYTQPIPRKDITVLGKQSLGLGYVGANSMLSGNYISEHDVKISQKLAYVMSGGDLSQPSLVSEQYLLDMERQAFLSLATERKTLERMQSIINGGKVLRN